MQEKAVHDNVTAGKKMIKFHLEEMSSRHITYPFEDDGSPAQDDATKTKSKRKGRAVRQGRKHRLM